MDLQSRYINTVVSAERLNNLMELFFVLEWEYIETTDNGEVVPDAPETPAAPTETMVRWIRQPKNASLSAMEFNRRLLTRYTEEGSLRHWFQMSDHDLERFSRLVSSATSLKFTPDEVSDMLLRAERVKIM